MYLDCKGLLAVWREGLLARKVLEGVTVGYRKHPQLSRFTKAENPITAIDTYLSHVLIESQRRCYRFDGTKINFNPVLETMSVTDEQLAYEIQHLKSKLEKRDRLKFEEVLKTQTILPNPMFKVISGGIEYWEKSRL